MALRDWIPDPLEGLWDSLINTATVPEGYAPGNDLGQSKYDFSYKVFPNDIGMDHVGHYMIININVPTKGFRLNGLGLGTPATQYGEFITKTDQVSKVDTLRYGNSGGTGTGRPLTSQVPRQTRRIEQSIALFMPQGLYWYQEHLWEDISMTELAGKVAIGLTSALPSFIGDRIAGGIASATQQGGTINQAAQVMGSPINPTVEVMFSTTALRHFTFDFLFAPRNDEESQNLREIIAQLKFHSAPEINPTTMGATWIPPAEFDITFFKHGVENRNISRINTCVMENMEVDYHPSGIYSTFRNGHPVQVRMRLQFKEVEPIHKQRVLQGF